jgi:hypothetical protein
LKAIASLGVAVALVFGATAIPSYAAENTLKVSNPPAEFIIGEPGNLDPKLNLIAIVTGPVAAQVNVEFVDYLFDDSGNKTRLPGNSTPHSLAKVFTVVPFQNKYRPSASGAEFLITLKPKQKTIEQIYFGGIKVSMSPIDGSKRGGIVSAASTGAIASQVNVTPYGFVGDIENGKIIAAEVSRINFTSTNRTSILDSFIPDLPGLVNSGPIEAKVRYQNRGNLPVFASVGWEISANQKVLATKRTSKTILLGGRSATRSVITQSNIEGSEERINVLPDFGAVKIKTTLDSELGGTKFDPVTVESSVFVVQWKEPFFFTALIACLIWYVSRRRPSKGGQKRREPSLVWLALKAFKKYLKNRLAKPSNKAV